MISPVIQLTSPEEVNKAIREDNLRRCEFFRHFEYDSSDLVGRVRTGCFTNFVGMFSNCLQMQAFQR